MGLGAAAGGQSARVNSRERKTPASIRAADWLLGPALRPCLTQPRSLIGSIGSQLHPDWWSLNREIHPADNPIQINHDHSGVQIHAITEHNRQFIDQLENLLLTHRVCQSSLIPKGLSDTSASPIGRAMTKQRHRAHMSFLPAYNLSCYAYSRFLVES